MTRLCTKGVSGTVKPNVENFKLGFGGNWVHYYLKALEIYRREANKVNTRKSCVS